eukprot:GILI01023145.1.p1 GENE.GILI01023145.1~~GILI01023145.1.p1  ORF type:complete len:239 (+),score=39.39 GILI01023145.1:107-718(+)
MPSVLVTGASFSLISFLQLLQNLLFLFLSFRLCSCRRLCVLVSWTMSTWQYFYATGHTPKLSALRIDSAFVGIDEFEFWSCGVLLGLNTFSPFLLSFSSMLLASLSSPLTYLPLSLHLKCLWRPLLASLAFHFVDMSLMCVSVLANCRHLMVWAIFAPRLIFQGAVSILVTVFALMVVPSLSRLVRLSASSFASSTHDAHKVE